MKICEGIYSYIWEDYSINNCNSYLIDGDIPILIDPGLSPFTGKLMTKIGDDNLSSEKIKLIVLTHSHPDHIHGISQFLDSKITMSHEEYQFLSNEGKQIYSLFGINIPDFPIEFFLGNGDLNVGKNGFKIFLTPGHSPGSICLYHPKSKALFTGDLVFEEGVGRVDFPGGNIEDLQKSINLISKLEIEFLCPGHGNIIEGKKQIQRNFEIIKKMIF